MLGGCARIRPKETAGNIPGKKYEHLLFPTIHPKETAGIPPKRNRRRRAHVFFWKPFQERFFFGFPTHRQRRTHKAYSFVFCFSKEKTKVWIIIINTSQKKVFLPKNISRLFFFLARFKKKISFFFLLLCCFFFDRLFSR